MDQGTYHEVDHPLVAGVKVMPGSLAGQERPKAGFEYISPSQIKSYKYCAGQYWLKYGLFLEEKQTSSLVRGSALHAGQHAFFAALKTGDANIDPVDAAIAAAREYLRTHPIDVYSPRYQKGAADTPESLDEDMVLGVTTLVDHWWKLKVHATEQGYVIFWRDPNVLPVLGYCDIITDAATPDERAAVDLKTSVKSKSARDVEFDVALAIYAAGHELLTGIRTRESKYLMYCFTKERKALWVDGPALGGPADLTRVFTIAKGLTLARSHGIYLAIPDPMVCKSCSLIVDCDRVNGKIGIADRTALPLEIEEAA